MATDDERFEDDDRDREDRPRRRDRREYEQEHRGGLILALGIIGLVACAPVGIAAWVLGNNDLKAMDAGQMDPEGKQLTQVGKILGMVATILMIVGMCIGIAYFIFVIAIIGAAGAGGAR
jgi:uncharacterized membrane protein YidH (DUF202 family)